MRRLICTFDVRIWLKQVFSWSGSILFMQVFEKARFWSWSWFCLRISKWFTTEISCLHLAWLAIVKMLKRVCKNHTTNELLWNYYYWNIFVPFIYSKSFINIVLFSLLDDSSKKHSPAPEPIQEEKSSAPPTSGPQPNALSVHQDDNVCIANSSKIKKKKKNQDPQKLL